MSALLDWAGANATLLWWLAGGSAVLFVATLLSIPFLVVRIPADYFAAERPRPDSWRARHPVIRFAVRALKNAVGVLLIAAGLALSLPLVPGPGIVTLLVGISLVEFPGKRRCERWLVRTRPVLRAINWTRARAGRPPLDLSEGPGD